MYCVLCADANSRARRRLDFEKEFVYPASSPQAGAAEPIEPIEPTEEERAKNKTAFLARMRDFQVGSVFIYFFLYLFTPYFCDYLLDNKTFQWSHRLPERTLADMLKVMTQGEISDYIRSGQKMPHKHTEADREMQTEVKLICTPSIRARHQSVHAINPIM